MLFPVSGVDRAASHHTGPRFLPTFQSQQLNGTARDTTEMFRGRPQTPVLASTLECSMIQSNVRSRMQAKYHPCKKRGTGNKFAEERERVTQHGKYPG